MTAIQSAAKCNNDTQQLREHRKKRFCVLEERSNGQTRNRRYHIVLGTLVVLSVAILLREGSLLRLVNLACIEPCDCANIFQNFSSTEEFNGTTISKRTTKPTIADSKKDYAIFFHVFINPERTNSSYEIINEQLGQWKASTLFDTKLYYGFIGNAIFPFPCPHSGTCHQLFHQETGWELDTLQKLHDYCRNHPSHKVVYLHDKGSFHEHDDNHRLRRALTRAALSDECRFGLASGQCNICSARFSPMPHWHVTGNMWTANCEYIASLIAPINFTEAVESVVRSFPRKERRGFMNSGPGMGIGRFASEHWAHTSPRVKPCDVFTDPQLTWSYTQFNENCTLQLSPAPRYPLRHFEGDLQFDNLNNPFYRLKYRVYELRQLYNELPPADSFIWLAYAQADLI